MDYYLYQNSTLEITHLEIDVQQHASLATLDYVVDEMAFVDSILVEASNQNSNSRVALDLQIGVKKEIVVVFYITMVLVLVSSVLD